MRWRLVRDRREISLRSRGTPGDLYVDGVRFCATLEDAERQGEDGVLQADEKVAHHTAIPPGAYVVRLTPSWRFKRHLPLVEGVPQFSGVRFHRGNTTADTSGCILVGRQRVGLVLTSSKLAEEELVDRLRTAGGEAQLVVE